MEVKLGLAEPLKALVTRRYLLAKSSGALTFSKTEVTSIKTGRHVPFQLRYCPALAKKPKDNDSKNVSKPKSDPFEHAAGDLFLCQIPASAPTHNLFLNKYPVISNHFILATEMSKPQTDLLEESDLGVAHACLRAWTDQAERTPAKLFAFFNSGEHSGASQPHRHLQFLPVEDMMGSRHEEWKLLIDGDTDEVTQNQGHPRRITALPFVSYVVNLDDSISAQSLHLRYKQLLAAAVDAVAHHDGGGKSYEDTRITENSKPIISYNLAMTVDRMAICPRRAEGTSISQASPESFVSINGTILGGTMMVKDEREYEILQKDTAVLDEIFSAVAYPNLAPADSIATKL